MRHEYQHDPSIPFSNFCPTLDVDEGCAHMHKDLDAEEVIPNLSQEDQKREDE